MTISLSSYHRHQLSITELSKRVGMSREYVHMILAGKKGQTLENVEKLATALSCAPIELLPESWQHPHLTQDAMVPLITKTLRIYEESKDQLGKLTPAQLARLITFLILRNEDHADYEIKNFIRFTHINEPIR